MTEPSHDALKHLARLYAFAQLVTPDPAAAARLVRATYRRAFESPAPFPEGEAGRLFLYRLLLDVRREERGEAPTTLTDDVSPRYDARDDLASSRERHAQRLLELHLPPALVSLDTADRLLLLLCDVEGQPCDEAARVLDLPPVEACTLYEQARATLRERILASVSVHEQAMLEEALTPERMRLGIAGALQDELAPLPPTLRPQIVPPPREEPSEMRPPNRITPWIRIGYLALLLFALAIAAYLMLQRTPVAGETNLIVLAARHAPEAQITLGTQEATVAEQFVLDHVGWRLALPQIQDFALQGAGLAEVVPGVTLPVFRYAADDSARITLYALTYSLLDQTGPQLSLEPDVLDQLEDDTHFDLHDIEGTQVLLWRSRDDLFLAVSSTPDPTLARRITP